MKSTVRGTITSGKRVVVRTKRSYNDWNGANVEITNLVFGVGLPNCSASEESLTAYDILNCITFSDCSSKNITITFSKDFLRRILKSHIHQLNENKII